MLAMKSWMSFVLKMGAPWKRKKTIVNSSIFGGELLVLGDGKKSALKTDEMNFETTEELHTPKNGLI